MNIIKTPVTDLLILEPRRFGDDRGFFSETWSARTMAEAGVAAEFVQDNHSFSTEAKTVRGLHF
jgi:dTDP-4-dehydrorhamnose 3,5-epimerase